MKVGILLPAFNEEENIQAVIREAKKYLPKSKIVVVDDGSTDNTYKMAKKTGVTVVRHEKNRGKGEALKTGFRYFLKTSEDVVIVTDTDRQYQIKDATKLLKPIEHGEADFVTGYRDWSIVPLRHMLGNLVWRTFFNLLFGTHFRDTNCGFVALTKKAMKKIRHTGGGYIIENAIFIDALRNNLRIKQVPVDVIYKEKSGVVRGGKMVLGVLVFIFREGLKYRFGKK